MWCKGLKRFKHIFRSVLQIYGNHNSKIYKVSQVFLQVTHFLSIQVSNRVKNEGTPYQY